MKLRLTTQIAAFRRRLEQHPKQQAFAAMRALNDAAFAARRAEQVAMRAVFDRPTPYVLNSVLVRQASRDKLVASVYVDFFGPGKAPPPERVLQAEVFGGARALKRAERRLQAVGLLPPGMAMVPTRQLLSDTSKVDAYGNVRGTFIRRLLSYFQAFREAGYQGNMSAATRKRLARRGRGDGGFARINGVEYFVSRGKGTWFGARGWRGGRAQHLPAGIWQRRGTHGSDIQPLFLFVRLPSYAVRLRFHDVAERAVERTFRAAFARHLQRALETAR